MPKSLRAAAGSIVLKIAGMLLVMGALTAAAIVTGLSLFGQFSESLGRFQAENVPNLKQSSEIIATTGDLGEGLSALLIAGSKGEMDASVAQAQEAIARLRELAGPLGGEAGEALRGEIDSIGADISGVASARETELVYDEATLEGSDALGGAVARAARYLADASGQTLSDVLGSNAATLVGQVRTDLETVDRATDLERLIGEVQSAILTGASADDAEGVTAAQETATGLVERIGTLSAEVPSDADFSAALEEIRGYADPAEGILAARQRVIEARGEADTQSRLAAESVVAITETAREMGRVAMGDIESASGRLDTAAGGGRGTMTTIAAVGIAVLVVAAASTYYLIVRPLVSVTRVTERLAEGHRELPPNFDRQSGEIGRMAAALVVFRDGMIERERLEREEREREKEALERTAREQQQAREREESERKRQSEIEAEKREREARELEARERLRAEADAERQARVAEQEKVVSVLAAGMKELAGGDLSVRIDEAFPGEYDALRQDFNAAVSTLSNLIGQIAESAGRIDEGSAEISSAAIDLSRRTEASAATLEETAAALSELTVSVDSAAEGAGQANKVAHDTNNRAESSKQVVGEAVSAMSEIEESSKKIAKIIDVIDDIAFQTNLLALNAGIEAARAGEAGRGFAVVASEVRALAQRSSDAAREINGLISTSNGQVERGADLVNQAGNALQDIIEGVAEITRKVGDIAASAQEQASGIAEINSATGQLDGTMQQNAAMTEETTAASRVLTDESRKLIEMIARFRITAEAGVDREESRAA